MQLLKSYYVYRFMFYVVFLLGRKWEEGRIMNTNVYLYSFVDMLKIDEINFRYIFLLLLFIIKEKEEISSMNCLFKRKIAFQMIRKMFT